jgi:hypothetical protein
LTLTRICFNSSSILLKRSSTDLVHLDALRAHVADRLIVELGAGVAGVDQQLGDGVDGNFLNAGDGPEGNALDKLVQDLRALCSVQPYRQRAFMSLFLVLLCVNP